MQHYSQKQKPISLHTFSFEAGPFLLSDSLAVRAANPTEGNPEREDSQLKQRQMMLWFKTLKLDRHMKYDVAQGNQQIVVVQNFKDIGISKPD